MATRDAPLAQVDVVFEACLEAEEDTGPALDLTAITLDAGLVRFPAPFRNGNRRCARAIGLHLNRHARFLFRNPPGEHQAMFRHNVENLHLGLRAYIVPGPCQYLAGLGTST